VLLFDHVDAYHFQQNTFAFHRLPLMEWPSSHCFIVVFIGFVPKSVTIAGGLQGFLLEHVINALYCYAPYNRLLFAYALT
jgi:hypothetical protein